MAEIRLSTESYETIKRDQRRLLDLLPRCDQFDSCGIDTTQYRTVIQQLLNDIEQLEVQFVGPRNK